MKLTIMCLLAIFSFSVAVLLTLHTVGIKLNPPTCPQMKDGNPTAYFFLCNEKAIDDLSSGGE